MISISSFGMLLVVWWLSTISHLYSSVFLKQHTKHTPFSFHISSHWVGSYQRSPIKKKKKLKEFHSNVFTFRSGIRSGNLTHMTKLFSLICSISNAQQHACERLRLFEQCLLCLQRENADTATNCYCPIVHALTHSHTHTVSHTQISIYPSLHTLAWSGRERERCTMHSRD